MIDWTDVGININNYDKFIWFSQGRGGATGTYTEYCDVDYVSVRKYTENNPSYSIGEEKLVRQELLTNNTFYSKVGERVKLVLKNNKLQEITNIELKPNEGRIEPYFILSIKPGEEKEVFLSLDDKEPAEKKVIISINYDQGSESAEEDIILYKEELLSAIENCRITDYSNNCTAVINKKFKFNTSREIIFTHSVNNLTEARCFKGTEQIETAISNDSTFIKTKSSGSFGIQCEFKANAGKVEEKERGSYNVSLEKAVTRIPLIFKNPYDHPVEVNWAYEKQAPPTYIINNIQGSFLLEENNSTQYVYLTSDAVIAFKILGRQQAANYSSEVNGYSYSQIPLLIKNEDLISLNITWSIPTDNGFEPVKMNGSVVIPSQKEATVFGIEKNKALTGKIIQLELLEGSIENQNFKATLEITNNDIIPYSSIMFENNTINITIEARDKINATSFITADLVNESFEVLGLNNSTKTMAVVEKTIKTSIGEYNFTGNLSITNQSIEGWNCTQKKTTVTIPGKEVISVCTKENWIKELDSMTEALDEVSSSSEIKIRSSVGYESKSEYPIPITLKFKNTTTKVVVVYGNNTVFFERKIPVKYEKQSALFSFDYDNNEMINISLDEKVDNARININKDYLKASVFTCFNNCYDKNSWSRAQLEDGFVKTSLPVLLIISYESGQEKEEVAEQETEEEQENVIIKDMNLVNNENFEKASITGDKENITNSEDLKTNTSNRAENNGEKLLEKNTSSKGFVVTGNASSALKPVLFSVILTIALLVCFVLRKHFKAREISTQA